MASEILVLIILITAAAVTTALVRRDHPPRARSLRWALYSCAGAIACTVASTIVVGDASAGITLDPDAVGRLANLQAVARAFALAFVANAVVMLAVGLDLPASPSSRDPAGPSPGRQPSEDPSYRRLYFEQRRENRRLRRLLSDPASDRDDEDEDEDEDAPDRVPSGERPA